MLKEPEKLENTVTHRDTSWPPCLSVPSCWYHTDVFPCRRGSRWTCLRRWAVTGFFEWSFHEHWRDVTVFVCQISEVLLPTHQTSSTNLQLSELVLLGQKAIQIDGETHTGETEVQDQVTQHHMTWLSHIIQSDVSFSYVSFDPASRLFCTPFTASWTQMKELLRSLMWEWIIWKGACLLITWAEPVNKQK